jgi:hypothetical protein
MRNIYWLHSLTRSTLPLPFSTVLANFTAGAEGSYSLHGATLSIFGGASHFDATLVTLYIATFPNMTGDNLGQIDVKNGMNCNNIDDTTVLRCMLYNSSCHVSVSFENGAQAINILRDGTLKNQVAVYDGPRIQSGATLSFYFFITNISKYQVHMIQAQSTHYPI